MKLRGFLAAVVVCMTVNAVQAERALPTQLITPTLWVVSPDNLACNLTNVSERTQTVQVRIITNGVILLDSGLVTVDPMHTANHFVEGLENGGPIYCEFSVEGAKNWYRGAAKLFRNSPSQTDFLVVAAE